MEPTTPRLAIRVPMPRRRRTTFAALAAALAATLAVVVLSAVDLPAIDGPATAPLPAAPRSEPTGPVTATLAPITATVAPTPTGTSTVGPTAPVTPTVEITSTSTATIAVTPTVAITPTPTATVAVTPTVEITPMPTTTVAVTPTVAITPTPTATVAVSPTVEIVQTPTATVAVSPTATIKPTPTVSLTPTVAITPTDAIPTAVGPTAVATPTTAITAAATVSATPPSATPPSATPTAPRPTRTPTRTPTPRPTARPPTGLYLPLLSRQVGFESPRPRVWGTQFVMEMSDAHHADDVAIELPRARAAGIGSIRAAIWWAWIEPANTTPDKYDWRKADRLLGDYSAAGFDVMVMLVGYPGWATEFGCGGGLRPGMEVEWREFTRALAARYAKPPYRIAAWEIGNEVDGTMDVDDGDRARPAGWGRGEPTSPMGGCWVGREAAYATFLRAAYASIKSADPTVLVTLGGLAYVDSALAGRADFDIRFLDRLLAAGGGPYFDFFNYHWFLDYKFQPHGPERHRQAVATLARYGFVKPVWISETYRTTEPHIPGTEITQVRFLSREIFPMLALPDIERFYWYGFVDYPHDVEDQRGKPQRGLVDGHHRPKPAFAILPHTIRHTNGLAQDISTDRVTAWRFTWPRSGTSHVVAWSTKGKPVRWQAPAAVGRQAVVRSFAEGRVLAGKCCDEIAAAVQNGGVWLDLGADPVFVEIGP